MMRTGRIGLAILVCVALCSCSASEAKPTRNAAGIAVHQGVPDTCQLVSAADVQRLTGRPIAEGRPTGTGHGCSFLAVGAGDAPLVASIFVEVDDTAEAFDDDAALMRRQADVQGLGLGDQSYAWTEGGRQGAEARAGSTRLRVLLNEGPVGAASALLGEKLPLIRT